MANVIDYLKWRGDFTIDVAPFNEIDALVFSELAYLPFELVLNAEKKEESLSQLGKTFFSKEQSDIKLGAIMPEKEIKELFLLASKSKRFKDVKLRNYVNVVSKTEEKQFCCMSFILNKELECVAFRGTDDTLVGWKEDFNMSFNTPVPSQIEAVNYINLYGVKTRRKLIICGHSKGGNLASYASLMALTRVKKKIIKVYSFDGPGFRKEFLESFSDQRIKDITTKILPKGSIIGMIYHSVGDIVPIKSAGKGFYQHDAFNWEVLGDSFVRAEKLDKSSVQTQQLLDKWTNSMSLDERSEFVEALYRLVSVNETATLTDIASDKFKFMLGIIKADGKTKKVFLSAINRLIKEKYFKKEKNKEKSHD